MRFSLVIVALLCLIPWMSSVHATLGRVSNCCLRLSTTKVKLERVVNYTHQLDNVCPIKAVVFETDTGTRICSDPNSQWAQRAIAKVDEESLALQVKGNNEEGSARDVTTAVPSTSTNTPKNTLGRVSNCCLQLSTTKVKLERVVNYTHQLDNVCPIKAVVFETDTGTRICSDPDSQWAQRAIAKVDEESLALQVKGNNEEGSARDVTTAVPSTSKNTSTNTPKTNAKSLNRRRRRMLRRLREMMKQCNN